MPSLASLPPTRHNTPREGGQRLAFMTFNTNGPNRHSKFPCDDSRSWPLPIPHGLGCCPGRRIEDRLHEAWAVFAGLVSVLTRVHGSRFLPARTVVVQVDHRAGPGTRGGNTTVHEEPDGCASMSDPHLLSSSRASDVHFYARLPSSQISCYLIRLIRGNTQTTENMHTYSNYCLG